MKRSPSKLDQIPRNDHEARCKERARLNRQIRDAAPELLEALKTLVSVVKDLHPDAEALGGLEEAEDAISKAEGIK